ncbi:hypothetical protein HZH68_008781 [Vespula germanica]|uniref:Uncharacterized protein n=1 Tax=Vespula germanica TaxID=30212 RepID=A0A834K305_VESGE|nr:hypothetical protein HZH68_008781 [Vespula germanica]
MEFLWSDMISASRKLKFEASARGTENAFIDSNEYNRIIEQRTDVIARFATESDCQWQVGLARAMPDSPFKTRNGISEVNDAVTYLKSRQTSFSKSEQVT